ncbi:MAG: hypothetical protein PHW62_00605 [Candidatus Ratteibacteria bacterium]|nr:hypothetical protein [Candidatus Ratteibacteria bacterium]
MNASQWTTLKKQPDKAKKMLSALHMSSAYLKVSWDELDEGEQRKISQWIAKNGSGWFEKGEPTSTPEGIKVVAPKHRKAAIKKESEVVLRKPMKKEKPVKPVRTETKGIIPKPVRDIFTKEQIQNPSEFYFAEFGDRITIEKKPIGEDVYRSSSDRINISTPMVTKHLKKEELNEIQGWLKSKGEQLLASNEYVETPERTDKEIDDLFEKLELKIGDIVIHKKYKLQYKYLGIKMGRYEFESMRGGNTKQLYKFEVIRDFTKESEPKPDEDDHSTLERAKRAGIDLEGLYIDDSEGIRFRMLDGAFKGKTAFRCPEDYRGLVFNSNSKLSCGEHGALTSPENAIDLRKIGIDDKTTKWARQQFKGWLAEAKEEGFNTVAAHVDSLKAKDGKNGYAQYAELGRGLEETFATAAKGISREIDEELAAEKKKSEPEKSDKKSYYKIVSKDGKYVKELIKKPYPFEYATIEFVSHFEGSDWHTTEVTTGLKFTSGKSKDESESAAKEIIEKHGAVWVMEQIKTAKQSLEEAQRKPGGT